MGERDKLGVWDLYEHTTILKIDNFKKKNRKGKERRVAEDPSTLVLLLAISRNYTIIFFWRFFRVSEQRL